MADTLGAHCAREPGAAGRFSEQDAERHLRSLELFGMRFGLDRMRRMMTVLGSPERRFGAIHVVGTNGKTSTTRMLAAILERHGLRTGTYTSPHLRTYRERVRVAERELHPDAFAGAIQRAAWAAERVNRTLSEGDHVTQFELLTAAAFLQMAERGVDVAVVEAGLGGRYDATSVIDAPVTVLTNVSLEHTRWLGPTVADIAEEKLAVVAAAGTLVHGADLHPDARAVADRVVRERGASSLEASADTGAAPLGELAAPGEFQRRNFALARAAAGVYLASLGIELEERAVSDAGAATRIPGRLQLVAADPPTVLDGAHNPDAAAALARSLPELLARRPLALVLGVLEDKDASGMLGELLGICERAWFTAPASPRALSPAALHSRARQLGFAAAACQPRPVRALAEARSWARERGGAVLATGSVYLVGELLAEFSSGAGGAVAAPPSHRARR